MPQTTGGTGPAVETKSRAQGPLVLIAALVTVVLWASAFIGIRGAGPHFDPGALALLRMAVGAAVLTIIAVRHGIRLPARRHWLLVAVWGHPDPGPDRRRVGRPGAPGHGRLVRRERRLTLEAPWTRHPVQGAFPAPLRRLPTNAPPRTRVPP